MQSVILYHANCPDGFGAAWAAWRVLGDTAGYLPVAHGQPWPAEDVAGRDVFILDFSFPVDQLEALARTARSVTLLDHHITARQPWADRLSTDDSGLSTYSHPELPLRLVFDLNKSGARLAWEHFHPGQPLPLALAHIEDQDLWRYALEGTRAFCRALRLHPFDFAAWDALIAAAPDADAPGYRQMRLEGDAIERFCSLEIRRLAGSSLVSPARLRGEPVDAVQALRHGQPTVDDGAGSWLAVRGLAINASPLIASDLGHLLAEQSGTFGLIWQVGGGEAKVSLRAAGKIDVAAIAERYGGGGHRNAAGFRLPVGRFFSEILGIAPDAA